MPLPTKKDLVERIGMSVDYWDGQCTAQSIPFTKIGNKIFFTEEQISRILEMHAVEPKRIPTRDEVARKRSSRLRGAS